MALDRIAAKAAPFMAVDPPTPSARMLLWEVAGQTFANDLGGVVEVTRAAAITALAGSGDLILGYLDLRGDPLVVLDGRRVLGLETRETLLSDRFLVLNAGAARFAVRVDAVLGIDLVEPVRHGAAADQKVAITPGVRLSSRGTEGLVGIVDVARAFTSAVPAAAVIGGRGLS